MPASRGQKFRIRSLSGSEDSLRRLEELGFFKGAEIEVIVRLPFKGPWIVGLGATSFALRSDEADLLHVEGLS